MKIFIAILTSSLMLFGCGQKDDSKKDAAKGPNTFEFALDNAALKDSHFCPDKNKEPLDNEGGYQFEKGLIERKLEEGLLGFMHGVRAQNKQYVFTYRSQDPDDPMAFFKAEEFSLVASKESVTDVLQRLNRHDKVSVKGRLLVGPGPLRHIFVEEIKILAKYQHAHKYDVVFDASAFKGRDQVDLLAKVHAIILDGGGLVVEYKDMILPVIVSKRHLALAKTIYRNDKIYLPLRISRHEGRPLHFYTDPSRDIRIVDYIKNCHKEDVTLEGRLVRFKKSPQINRDIYAVKVVDKNGIERNFTFFPKVDFTKDNANDVFMEIFQKIAQKSQDAWQASSEQPRLLRNHMVKQGVKVTVTGSMNIVSKTQANPQIYIKDPMDLAFSLGDE